MEPSQALQMEVRSLGVGGGPLLLLDTYTSHHLNYDYDKQA